jgi:hypothetical protein
MPYKKFENNDIFFNVIKAKPYFQMKIWNSNLVTNEQANYSSLNTLNANPAAYYPFLPKGAARDSFRTISQGEFSYSQYGSILSGAYPYTSSIQVEQFYQQSGYISEKRRVYALKNTLNSYLHLSQHYSYNSSFGNKAEQALNLVSIPSIFYGSGIEKGSVEMGYYVSGTLIAKLEDIKKNGELIQTTGALGSGSVAGVVLYNEGFIVLTGSWQLDPAFQETLIYNPAPAGDYPRWINWGAGHGQNPNSTASSSFDLAFKGTSYINTVTMMAHADKGELNHSNNLTYLKVAESSSVATSSSIAYVEYPYGEIKNTSYYPYENFTGSLQKQTYISKIGIYDEHKNLIGIAKLATPVRKTENRDFTFKLKVDI